MNETSQSILTILSVIFILALIVWLLWLVFLTPPDEEVSVENTVEEFGLRLKQVSLLASPQELEQTMKSQYGELVTPELIEEWLQNPSAAPGRLTSSPWPDRIETVSIVRTSQSRYEIRGYIIEIANTDLGTAVVARRPITLSLMLAGNEWLITHVALGPYEQVSIARVKWALVG